MTPQLVDHAHTDSCIVIGCNLVQPRATTQKNEHVHFWLQSHRSCITVALSDSFEFIGAIEISLSIYLLQSQSQL